MDVFSLPHAPSGEPSAVTYSSLMIFPALTGCVTLRRFNFMPSAANSERNTSASPSNVAKDVRFVGVLFRIPRKDQQPIKFAQRRREWNRFTIEFPPGPSSLV